jgi:hypothetical protein
MIPTIEDIVAGLIAGTYTAQQAIAWLYKHKELSAEQSALAALSGVRVPVEKGHVDSSSASDNDRTPT